MKQIEGIWLPDSDTHFQDHLEQSEHIDDKGTYQLKKIRRSLEWVPDNRRNLALDIGAHVGLWTWLLAREFEKVIAFEPVHDFADCLEMNCQEHPNVEIRRYGIGDSIREVDIVVEKENTGSSHIMPLGVKPHQVDNSIRTRIYPLNQVIDLTVDFMKIDVEGSELLVLRGATGIIEDSKPVIILEQKPRNAERYGFGQLEALRYLEKRGYEKVLELAGDHCVVHKSRL